MSSSSDGTKASEYVMVEWDDGSNLNTYWYLGLITDYNAEEQPTKFRDLGVEAYPTERFAFSSPLMHRYMVSIHSLQHILSLYLYVFSIFALNQSSK